MEPAPLTHRAERCGVSRINASSAGILRVAFRAPHKELWAALIRDLLRLPVIARADAALEILPGNFRRAPSHRRPGWNGRAACTRPRAPVEVGAATTSSFLALLLREG